MRVRLWRTHLSTRWRQTTMWRSGLGRLESSVWWRLRLATFRGKRNRSTSHAPTPPCSRWTMRPVVIIVTVIIIAYYLTWSAREAGAAAELAASRRGKICQHWWSVRLCAHRDRNLGPTVLVGRRCTWTAERQGAMVFGSGTRFHRWWLGLLCSVVWIHSVQTSRVPVHT